MREFEKDLSYARHAEYPMDAAEAFARAASVPFQGCPSHGDLFRYLFLPHLNLELRKHERIKDDGVQEVRNEVTPGNAPVFANLPSDKTEKERDADEDGPAEHHNVVLNNTDEEVGNTLIE